MPLPSMPGARPLSGAEALRLMRRSGGRAGDRFGEGGLILTPFRAVASFVRRRWLDLTVTFVVAYFAYHAVHGERGFLSWIDRTREVEVARHELARLQAQHQTLGQRVARLRPGRADADAVEEELRRLGYVRPDEVILLPQAPPPGR